MITWLELSDNDRRNLLAQVGRKQGLSPQAIEKDWWVTMVLKAIFTLPFSKHILFKGGTSLSKCWNLIERLSEDIDIAIDREYLGFDGILSKTQISDKLRRASCSFTRNTLQQELNKRLIEIGIPEQFFHIHVNITSISTTDPEVIELYYHSVFQHNEYLKNRVLIEVSGRSMREPKERVEINSIISTTYPNAFFSDQYFPVEAVSPQRTFLEKACLLHEEFSKDAAKIRVNRMSRHLYDLEKLMNTPIAYAALHNENLYRAVVEHRQKFIGLKGFDYSTLMPQYISFVPPEEVVPYWEEDYKDMQATMIYGDSLPFDQLLDRIRDLNEMFKNINW
jgi:hypothetical protein